MENECDRINELDRIIKGNKLKELKFLKLSIAQEMQKQFEIRYGYTPEILKVTHPVTRKTEFIIVKPKGLKKI